MYYKEFKKIIESIIQKDLDREVLIDILLTTFDCEKIYESDDKLITDIYFSLKHFASGEEIIGDKEWLYFLDCLNEKRKYKFEEKMAL